MFFFFVSFAKAFNTHFGSYNLVIISFSFFFKILLLLLFLFQYQEKKNGMTKKKKEKKKITYNHCQAREKKSLKFTSLLNENDCGTLPHNFSFNVAFNVFFFLYFFMFYFMFNCYSFLSFVFFKQSTSQIITQKKKSRKTVKIDRMYKTAT